MSIERTRLKFVIAKETDEVVGFVSRTPKSKRLRGVPENSDYGKMICVLAEDLKGQVVPNVTYDVELIPMHQKKGYVVISAKRPTFKAAIETIIVRKALYKVTISFGHKVINFDPLHGRSRYSRTISGVIGLLDSRDDIEDRDNVVAQFRKEAVELIRSMQTDGINVVGWE